MWKSLAIGLCSVFVLFSPAWGTPPLQPMPPRTRAKQTTSATQLFQQGERLRQQMIQLGFSGSLRKDKFTVRRLLRLMKQAHRKYNATLRMKDRRWLIAANYRIAELLHILFEKLDNLPAPTRLSAHQQSAYLRVIKRLSGQLRRQVFQRYRIVFIKAKREKLHDAWEKRALRAYRDLCACKVDIPTIIKGHTPPGNKTTRPTPPHKPAKRSQPRPY